jgi:hypothetical protein
MKGVKVVGGFRDRSQQSIKAALRNTSLGVGSSMAAMMAHGRRARILQGAMDRTALFQRP